MNLLKDHLHLHFLVLLWGFTAILGLLISIPVVEMVLLRTVLSFIGLLVVLKIMGVGIRLPAGVMVGLLLTGLLFTTHWLLFFGAARVSNASVALVGTSTATLWTALLEPLVNKRKIQGLEVGLGIIIIIGIYVIFKADLSYRLGLIMGIGAALASAVFVVINARFVKKYRAQVITCYEMLGASIGTLIFIPLSPYFLPDSGPFQFNVTAMDWFYISILAFVCTVYAYSASVSLMRRLSPYTINLVANLEPIYGIVLALLFFGDTERMQFSFYGGAAIIILSVLAYPILNRRLNRQPVQFDNLR